jgi:hypothetical protein
LVTLIASRVENLASAGSESTKFSQNPQILIGALSFHTASERTGLPQKPLTASPRGHTVNFIFTRQNFKLNRATALAE